MGTTPLVSVIVFTYNSASFILETLESVKAQKYSRIELIISDDCSTDFTVDICRRWIENNSSRFESHSIIESMQNTGISANCNRGEAACTGEWIKEIAGDDILLPSCIQDYIDYISAHPRHYFIFGKVIFFGDNPERVKIGNEQGFDYSKFNLSAQEQYYTLVFQRHNFVPAPTFFYNRTKAQEIGLKCDERIPLLDDWPKWIYLTSNGIKLQLLDKFTVKYRIHNASISTPGSIANRKGNYSSRLFFFLYIFPEIYDRNPQEAIDLVLSYEKALFDGKSNLAAELDRVLHTRAYKIGRILLDLFKAPIRLLRK